MGNFDLKVLKNLLKIFYITFQEIVKGQKVFKPLEH